MTENTVRLFAEINNNSTVQIQKGGIRTHGSSTQSWYVTYYTTFCFQTLIFFGTVN